MKYIIIFSFSLLVLSGCNNMEEEITWKTKNIPAKAVVEGGITSDVRTQVIRLSQTADYFVNEQTPRIAGAHVTVSDGTRTYIFEESASVPGEYLSSEKFAGIPGLNYNLNVDLASPIDGYSELQANDNMVKGFTIESMEVYVFKNPIPGMAENKEDTTGLLFFMNGTQPEDIDNYYVIQVYQNGKPLFYNVSDLALYTDKNDEDPSETEMILYYVENVFVNDTISIELTSVSKEYYEYIRTLKLVATPPDPLGFSGPPADAIGNINNGTQLGFFNTGHKSRFTAIAMKPEGW